MSRRFPGSRISDMVTEIGESYTDGSGFVKVPYTAEHYINIVIVVSPVDDSYNAFVQSKSSMDFTIGPSAPNKKFFYKIMSTRA